LQPSISASNTSGKSGHFKSSQQVESKRLLGSNLLISGLLMQQGIFDYFISVGSRSLRRFDGEDIVKLSK
jgi:hypothetical protein